VFFDLHARGLLRGRKARLVDANPDLVGCYRMLRDRTTDVIAALGSLADQHRTGGEAHFYDVRDKRFNPARANAGRAYTPELAAMLIYLNRTGYNGLFRLNGRGEFNVPAGRYANPRICDEATLRAVAEILDRPSIRLAVASFQSLDHEARPADFVYFDPPYAPLTSTARFTSYTPGCFSEEDQRSLRDLAVRLAGRGCFVMLSNSAAPLVSALYETADVRRAGLRAYRVSARRAINSNSARRGQVDEFIITNVARSPVHGPGSAST
jgi:DNA adenine methylase